jgi:hypothetical protein
MAPAALAGRRHSRGVPRPAMARPPGEPRVSRSRPEGMRRRENEPIHGPGSLGRSEAQPRCASTCDGSPSRRASRKPKQARRDASARKRAHPCPRRAWPGVVAAKVRPAGQAVAPPGDRGRRWRGSITRAYAAFSNSSVAAVSDRRALRLAAQVEGGRQHAKRSTARRRVFACGTHTRIREGMPLSRRRAMEASAAMDGGAQRTCSERRPGTDPPQADWSWPQRTSGGGVGASPTFATESVAAASTRLVGDDAAVDHHGRAV